MLAKLTNQSEHLETQSNANKKNLKLEVSNTALKSRSPKNSKGRALELMDSTEFELNIQS